MRFIRVFGHVFFCLFLFPTLSPIPCWGEIPSSPYARPLRFDVVNDGVVVPPLRLDWDLTTGKSLNIAGVYVDDKSFLVGIYKLNKLDLELTSLLKSHNSEWLLVAKWPTELLLTGTFEAFNRSGRVLWTRDLVQHDFDQWQEQQKKWRDLLLTKDIPEKKINQMTAMNLNLVLLNFQSESQPFWQLKEPFRLCLTSPNVKAEGGYFTRLCSRLLEVSRTQPDSVSFDYFPQTPQPARVIIDSKTVALKGSAAVLTDRPIQFYAELTSGISLEFYSNPVDFDILEITSVKGSNQYHLMATGPKPNKLSIKDVKEENLSYLKKLFGPPLAPSIGNLKTYWETDLPKSNPTLYISGKGGGLYKKQLIISKVPNDEIRPYIYEHSPQGTYSYEVLLTGETLKKTALSSSQTMVSMNANDLSFTWKFAAPIKGEINKSYIFTYDNQNIFKAYAEIYRGFPGELSARTISSLGTDGNSLISGELNASYWFESILGVQNRWLSYQRWGLSVSHVQSFNSLSLPPIKERTQQSKFNLKYRLTPGLWLRDPTWGIELVSYQIKYDLFQAPFIGLGGFFGRSMPKILDDGLNTISFLKYPKWIDFEFIYYPKTLTEEVTLNGVEGPLRNWQLNLHSKIVWNKDFFGELGFGIDQTDFIQYFNLPNITRLQLQLNSVYGTVGVGWLF